MIQIEFLNIQRLHVVEDFGFQQQIAAATSRLTLASDRAMVESYKDALATFDAALNGSPTNPHTPAVRQTDAQIKTSWRSLRAQAKVMCGHPVAECRATALKANELVRAYGDLTRMNSTERSARLGHLLRDLATLGAEPLSRICLDIWMDELQTLADAYREASRAHIAEQGKRETGLVNRTRTAADAAYRSLMSRVNALALIHGEADYAEFVGLVNAIIGQEKALLAARSTRAGREEEGE